MKRTLTLFLIALTTLSAMAANLTVAEGTVENTKLPVNGYYCDVAENHTQFVYPAADLSIVAEHAISALTFYAKNETLAWGDAAFVVKLAEVDDSALSGFLTPEFTEVYAGKLSIAATFLEINFTTNFTYSGKNLLVDISQSQKCSYSDANEPTFYGIAAASAGYGSKTGQYGMERTVDFLPQVTITYDGSAAPGSCDKPTKLNGTVTPDGGEFSWAGDEGAQYQWCVAAKDAEPADWALLDADVFTVTVKGLVAGTAYDFYVRTYCSESDQSAAYKRTFTPVCQAPANLALVATTANEAELKWDAAIGVSKYQYVCVLKDSALSWEGVEAKAGLSANLTGLQANTAYDFYLRSYFSADVQSAAAKLSFRTDCDAKSMPFRESFDTATLPDCWAIANRTGYGWAVYNGSADDIASICMRFTAKGSIGNVDTLELPLVNLSEEAILKMDVLNKAGLAVSLYASTDGGNTRRLVADLSAAVAIKTNKTIELSDYSGEVRLYLYGTATGESRYFDFDNLQIIAKPCTAPTGLKADVAATGAVLSWTAGGSEASWNVRYKVSGTSEWLEVPDLDKPTCTLTGLVSGTQYEAQVQAACNAGKASTWTGSVKFAPTCPVPTALTAAVIGAESAVLTWNGTEEAYKFQYKEQEETEWSEAIDVTGKTYTLTDLYPYTDYEVRVQAACEGDFVTARFATRCEAKSAAALPFSENFEMVETDALPECWFVLPAGAEAGVATMSEGGKKLYMVGQQERWVVLPAIESALSGLTLAFVQSGSARVEVGYLTAEDEATYVALQAADTSIVECNLENAPAAAKYVALRFAGAASHSTVYIDDVQLYVTGSMTALEPADANRTAIRKRIENGQLIIIREGVRYNAQGAVLQ